MKLIVGLGNPGLKYKNTRHNAGFQAIDALADDMGIRFVKKRFSGVTAEGRIGGEKVVLLKPHTYMNRSGDAVREAMTFFKIGGSDLIVMYDDVDLPFGRLRIREKGSAGTHNGMRSIVSAVGSGDFMRIRMGIGRAPERMDLADYVLARLSREEKKEFARCAKDAADAARILVREGAGAAQQKYH